ncbi:MAG: ATP-binding cassette domain-containing protein, partial [Actinomycetota bacterium]
MISIFINAVLALPLVAAYSMFALGIVVIYRASRVLNLAHGAMATVPAYIAYSLVNAGLPVAVAFLFAIAAGVALGGAVGFLVLMPLRKESETTQTVGTVAVLGVLISLVALVWGTSPLAAPNIFPAGRIDVGQTGLEYGDIGLAVVAALVAVAFSALFKFTGFGLAMRGAAENNQAARLMGINPIATTAVAWAIGGGLAATAGVLLAGVTNLHPYTLSRQVLPAFVAALIGGFGSLSGALLGAAVVGLAQGIISSVGPLAGQRGSAELVLAVIALVVMATRGKKLVGVSGTVTTSRSAAPRKRAPLSKMVRLVIWLVATPALLFWPFLPVADSIRGDANVAAIFVIVGVSLVMLTGWVGQISLAQASFVGVSAFVTALLVNSFNIPFPLNLPLAAGAAGLSAVALGMVALRVRGLYLAVATLIFGWMADAYLFKASWLVGEGGSATIKGRLIGREGNFPSFDLTDRRSFWFVALAGAVLALAAAANLRDGKVGRSFFAVRVSELAAASMGINVTRTKLLAFGVSGLLAGIAGNLIMVDQRTATPDQFAFTASLFFLSIAVVGGLTRLSGIVAAAIGFGVLEEVFYRVPTLGGYRDIVSSVLLLAAVLIAPIRSARSKSPKKLSTDVPTPLAPEPTATRIMPPKSTGGPLLELDKVTVRFGGLVASDDVSLAVGESQIVGLIGPNGAGKTTAFNVVSGFVTPMSGAVRLFGTDVTAMPVHERTALGVGRTFQVLQMFPDVTV